MATLVATETAGVRVLRLKGSLTCEGVEEIGPAFAAEAQGPVRLVVDLADVDMIATPGITMLLTADRALKQAGGRMILTGTRDFVQELLRRCRLDSVWTVVRDPAEAIRQAGQVQ
jgi:anti-anti-sigma factor